ncbi:Sporulation initiation inhibitor protein Soj [Emticicia aquatica]|uniref:Sporulation initiation inhibitor protein Soj n=1 Tax=Emticicia aquatica TaxID=1681835 RepID=A0ABM9APA6_9BACT|nr:ParA family protein [Emticicia aquatica]CAH0995658.1 Sporulation initiation inhibitor protein Soj [Emticicia aquatica]
MKTLSFVNNKGGVGKTTSAQNVGTALHRFANSRVLFVDLDAQASLTRCFGYSNLDFFNADSGSFILKDKTFEEVVISTEVGDLLPASMGFLATEERIKSSPIFPFNLKFALNKIKHLYDFIVIDCPPSLSTAARIALVASDLYFVPLQAEFLSYEGLRNFLTFASQLSMICPDLELGGVFATRYNPNLRRRLSIDLIKSTKKQLNEQFLDTYIRENVAIPEAQAHAMDIFSYDPDSNGAIDYYKLTREMINKRFTKDLMEQLLSQTR